MRETVDYFHGEWSSGSSVLMRGKKSIIMYEKRMEDKKKWLKTCLRTICTVILTRDRQRPPTFTFPWITGESPAALQPGYLYYSCISSIDAAKVPR